MPFVRYDFFDVQAMVNEEAGYEVPYLQVPASLGAEQSRGGQKIRTECIFKNGARALPDPEREDWWQHIPPPFNEKQRAAVVLRYVEIKLSQEERDWEQAYRHVHEAIAMNKRFPGSTRQPPPWIYEQLEAGLERIEKLKAKRAELLELTRDPEKEARDAARNAYNGAIVSEADQLAEKLKGLATRKVDREGDSLTGYSMEVK